MSRAQLTSTVEQNTGGAVSPYVAGKNKIINGDFGIWQRGTSFAVPGGAYLADRFSCYQDAAGATKTFSQQTFTSGTAPVAGGVYFARYDVSVAGTGGSNQNNIETNVENVQNFAGQTVTFSFYAKAAASLSVTPRITQYFGSGGSTQVATSGSAIAITTSWARYTVSFTLASISGKTIGTGSYVNIGLLLPGTGTFTFDTWGWQLEAGSVATPFTTATGTLSGELAACQRYYWRAGGDSVYQPYAVGAAQSTTTAQFSVQNPVPMRIAPTSIDFSTVAVTDTINAYSISAITFANAGRYASTVNTAASSLTTFRPYIFVSNNSTSGYFGLSAEL